MNPLFALDLARHTLRDAVSHLDLDSEAEREALTRLVEAIQLIALAVEKIGRRSIATRFDEAA